MVRFALPQSGEAEESKESGQSKSSICQPKDNIGISGTFFSAGNPASGDKPSTGLRRKYAIPKDNLGIACLPTSESVTLRDIPEEELADNYHNINANEPVLGAKDLTLEADKERSPPNPTKITGRARCIAPRDNLSSSGRHVDNVASQFRLRAGEDSSHVPHDELIQGRFEVCGGSRIKRAGPSKARGDADIFGVYADEYKPTVKPSETNHQPKPSEVGISNIRRPKHDPTQPRKLIVPKDNIGFSGRHLQKSSSRSVGVRKMREMISVKETRAYKSLDKKDSTSKSTSLNSCDKQTTTHQVKSLRAVSELTVLLLYLHFLLSYYLSFVRSEWFEELLFYSDREDELRS